MVGAFAVLAVIAPAACSSGDQDRSSSPASGSVTSAPSSDVAPDGITFTVVSTTPQDLLPYYRSMLGADQRWTRTA
jgi:hypothetical protein